MNHSAKAFIALLVLPLCIACTTVAAQGMYKCKNAAGKITYADNECHLIGLTSAGEVAGKASVTPALKSAPSQATPTPAAPKAAPQVAKSPAKEPAEPERRCFTVKTAKGTATRCNDKPGEDVADK